jgi:cell division protein ZapE
MKNGELLKIYNLDILHNKIIKDDNQIKIISILQKLYDELCKKKSFKGKIIDIILKKNHFKMGVYLWGNVGTGKTYLVNLFFESLPFKNKIRLHFHSFMKKVHNELSTLSGAEDPLNLVAKQFSLEYKILCLDEFFVSDIADAMVIGRLIEKLFIYKVYIVINSNLPPCDLYANGLQRQHFMKTIDLIENKLVVINIFSVFDYRLRILKDAEVYYSSNLIDVNKKLLNIFYRLSSSNEIIKNGFITILNRTINFVCSSNYVIWFDFYQLCSLPRSQIDYIEIAKIYHTVFITNIPILHNISDSEVRRFIALIDEFYDSNVKIIITTLVDIYDLYKFGQLSVEFKRTLSRLVEMKSVDYLSKKHHINYI